MLRLSAINTQYLLLAAVLMGLSGLFWADRLTPGPVSDGARPTFEATLLETGAPAGSAVLRGRPAVLDFWASWCGPCRQGLPKLAELSGRYGDRVRFLAVNAVDEPVEVQRRFRAETGLTLGMVAAGRAVASSFGVEVLPTTVVLDAEGRVTRSFQGGVEDAVLMRAIEAAGVSYGGP